MKKKASKKEISKFQKIRNAFAEKKSWTEKELAKKSGFDLPNVRTAMSILRNPKRTKDLLTTVFDKEKQKILGVRSCILMF